MQCNQGTTEVSDSQHAERSASTFKKNCWLRNGIMMSYQEALISN